MKYRKDDAAGDYVFGVPNAFDENSPEAVAHAIKTRLQLHSGEWFLDLTAVTPWETDVLGKYTKGAYDAALKGVILGTQGVNALVAYESAFDGNSRKLTVSARVDTIYGEALVTGPV